MEDETPDDIQEQIDNARDHVDDALNDARNALNAWMDAIYSIARTRQENTTTVISRDEPDSEGFWHDIDDDIWACDGYGNVRLIARGHQTDDDHREIYTLSCNYDIQGNGPFTKIDNPFIEREDHAN